MKDKRGFTITEMLAAFVIVALLIGIGVVSYNSVFGNASTSYYHTLESSLLLSGSDYFQDHREMLSANSYSSVSIKDLMDESYTDEIKDINGNLCLNGEVITYKDDNNRSQYEVCLKCGDYESTGKYCDGYDKTSNRVRVPTNVLCKSRPTYTGQMVALTIVDGSDGFTLSGNYQIGANESGYLITATIKDGYIWSDNSTDKTKSFYCKLYKKNPSIILNPYESNVVKSATINFTETAETEGTFFNSSDNDNIASVNKVSRISNSESVVEVKGIEAGKSTVIKVSFKPNDLNNYNEIAEADASKFKVNVINGIDKPTSAICNSDLIYNGKEQTLTKNVPIIGYTFRNNTGIDADTYIVEAKLEKGFVWKDNSSSNVMFECSIKKKKVSVNWGETNFIYNGHEQAPNASVDTGVLNESMTFDQTKNIYYGNYTSSVLCASVVGGRKKCENYELTNVQQKYQINRRDVTFKAMDQEITYGESIVQSIEKVEIVSGSLAETDHLSEVKLKQSSIYAIVPNKYISVKEIFINDKNGLLTNNNYNIKFLNGELDSGKLIINKKTISSNVISCNDKMYDGTTPTSCVLTLSGLLEKDMEQVSSTATCNFSDKNVSEFAKEVICSNISLTGGNIGDMSGNYELSSKTATGSARINIKKVVPTIVCTNKDYDGNTSVSCRITNAFPKVISTDNVDWNQISCNFSNSNAGTNKSITCSVTIKGTDGPNYLAEDKTLFGTINKATPSLIINPTSGTVLKNKIISFAVTSSVDGTSTVSSNNSRIAGVNFPTDRIQMNRNASVTMSAIGASVGSTTIIVNFTPTDTTNYNSVSSSYSLSVIDPSINICID